MIGKKYFLPIFTHLEQFICLLRSQGGPQFKTLDRCDRGHKYLPTEPGELGQSKFWKFWKVVMKI